MNINELRLMNCKNMLFHSGDPHFSFAVHFHYFIFFLIFVGLHHLITFTLPQKNAHIPKTCFHSKKWGGNKELQLRKHETHFNCSPYKATGIPSASSLQFSSLRTASAWLPRYLPCRVRSVGTTLCSCSPMPRHVAWAVATCFW